MRVDWGIIGGTGIGSRLLALPGRAISVETAEGFVRAHLVERDGTRIAVLSRHAAGHKVPPHAVPYRALALGLRRLGARGCYATAAVGSLRTDWGPGTIALCDDFLDLSSRNVTMFHSTIGHTDFTRPFDPDLRGAVLKQAEAKGLQIQNGGVYLNLNGPRYETPHEVRTFGGFCADVVGMTAGTEAVVMHEAGVPYALVAVVTNLGTGLSSADLHHGEVEDVMKARGGDVVDLLLGACGRLQPA